MSARARGRTRPLDLLAEPLEGLRLIEASAGTGKTHTLADLYLRLVLEGGRTVDQILVVTFTVAATAELRDRIRARLEAARQAFLRGAPTDPRDDVLAGLLARNPECAVAARRLAQAVQSFDEAAILTIHGFCQRVLRESAFESTQPFEVELVPDEGEILQEVVDDFWRKTLYQGPRLLVGYLLREGWTPEGLVKTVRPYLRRPSLAVRPPAPPAVGSEAESFYTACYREAREAWQTDRVAIGRLLGSQTSLNGSKYPPRSLPAWLEEIDAFLRPAEAHAAWCTRVEKFTTRALGAAIKKGGTPPAHPVFTTCERLTAAWQSLAEHLAFRARTLRLELLDYCRRELAARKERRQLTAYQDLLLRLDRSARGPARLGAGREPAPALFRGADRRVPGHRPHPVLDLQADLRRKPAPGLSGGGSQAGHLRFPGGGHLRVSGGGSRRGGATHAGSELALRSRVGPGGERRLREGRRPVPVRRDLVPSGAAGREGATAARRRGGRRGAAPDLVPLPRGRTRADAQGKGLGRGDPGHGGRDRAASRGGRSRRGPDRGDSAPRRGHRRPGADQRPGRPGAGGAPRAWASPASSSARRASSRRMRRRRSSASSWPWRSRGASRWCGPPWPRISSAWAGTRWRRSARTRRPGRRGRTRFSSTRPSGGTRDSSRCFADS